MIDWGRVAQLCNEIGADDFEEIVEIFLEEVEAEIEALRQSAYDTPLETRLHFLKGSALNLGFESFSNLCGEGEAGASNGQASNIDIPSILESYEASKIEFLDQRHTQLSR